MWEYNNTDELYHYGILGMRWGRRRTPTRSQINKTTFKTAKKNSNNKSDIRKAKLAYKTEKRAIRGDIESAARRQRDSSSFGERLLYNDATRRRAGKLMVERNMNEMAAISKAKKEAWRNTGLISVGLLGLGAYTYKKSK